MAIDHSRVVPERQTDAGFTLIELLIVVVIMGVLMATLASVITVALRTTPPTQARVDDARGLQGLVTWLPQDVDAAPPDGFDRDPAAWPCAAPAPADSYNVLTVTWTERTTSASDYAASYRYERDGTNWTMARYFCSNGGAPVRINLTSELPAWDSTDPPTEVVMCSVVVDASAVYNGNCPAADTYPATQLAPSPVRSIKLTVTLANGLDVTIDAAPKNPDASLADDPNAAANRPPTVANTAITLTLDPNETAVFDLASYFGAVNDPDGDESRLTVSVDPTEPLPTNLVSASTAYNGPVQFELTLTAGPVSGPSSPPIPLMLIVSDERGGWVVVQATIVVTDPPNVAPWLESPDPDTRVVGIPADEDTTTLTIPQLFNVHDDHPIDQLGVTITGLSVTATPTAVDTNKFVLTPSGGALIVDFLGGFQPSAGGEIYVDLLVVDADGAGLALHLTIQVLDHQEINDAPIATTSNVDVTIEAGQGIAVDVISAHGVYDTDTADDLTATILSSPSDITATASDTTASLTVSSTAAAGAPAPVVIRVSDLLGAYVDVTVIVTITEPPPPPPDCVLGTLTATPTRAARQGGGVTARKLVQSVTVTLTYTGTCDGLRLNYESGDPTGLGTGVGRVFPPGSPSSIVIVGHFSGGTEKFLPGAHVLTATTSSAVTPASLSTTLTVS